MFYNLMATRDPGFDADGTAGDGLVTWQHALDYVAALNAESDLGYSDWRLPEVKELSTIVDRSTSNPAIDTAFFIQDTTYRIYWTGTPLANRSGSAWTVVFNTGYVTTATKTYTRLVRPVRSVQASNNFVDNGDGTVSDTNTGLMWQWATDPYYYSWEQALVYCETLVLGGRSDWRMPNINELQSLVNYNETAPATDSLFQSFTSTKSSGYWSSTSDSLNTTYAWQIDFSDGAVRYTLKTTAGNLYGHVRAVRGGPCGPIGDSDGDGIYA